MREKWQVRCGWIKVHPMIDVETNQVLGLEVTDESVPEDQMFILLLDQVQQHCGEEHPVHRVLGDGAYDRNELCNVLEKRKILAGIKTRVDGSNLFDWIGLSVPETGSDWADIGCGRG